MQLLLQHNIADEHELRAFQWIKDEENQGLDMHRGDLGSEDSWV